MFLLPQATSQGDMGGAGVKQMTWKMYRFNSSCRVAASGSSIVQWSSVGTVQWYRNIKRVCRSSNCRVKRG